jgi:hypothetical protein
MKDPASLKIAEKLNQLHQMEAKLEAARNDPMRPQKKDGDASTLEKTQLISK